MKITNERLYIPGDAREALVRRHKLRYQFALEYINSGSIVLDFGCGSGYGSKMLSQVAKMVVGYDREKVAIDFACANNKTPETVFIHDLPENFFIFDAIVIIDVIEHLDEPEMMFPWLLKKLKKDGMMVLTTPEKIGDVTNPYHKREYTAKELDAFLSKFFRTVDIYSGEDYGISMIDGKQDNMLCVCEGKL